MQSWFPDLVLRRDISQKTKFQNVKGGWRKSCSTGSAITGFHGHFILVDDPLSPHEAVSEKKLETATDWFKETLPTRMVDQSITPTILIMQRVHEEDPSYVMLNQGTPVRHICLPATADEEVARPKGVLTNYGKTKLLDPIRLNKDVLFSAERRLGTVSYEGQYGQRPMARTGGMFKIDRLIVERINRSLLDPKKIVRYWDKAATKDGGAFTVGLKMALLKDGRIAILNVVRGQWDSGARNAIMKQTAEMDGKAVVIYTEQEPGAGGKESAEATVRLLAGYRVRLDRPSGDKAVRADPFSGQVNTGNVVLQNAEWNADYIKELQGFPDRVRFKDQVDASSGAFNNLTTPPVRIGAIQ